MTHEWTPFAEDGGEFSGLPKGELTSSLFGVGEIRTLLRGEIAAAHAYFKVMEKMRAHRSGGAPSSLQDIHDEHLQAVVFWKAQLRGEGEAADEDAGLWGRTVDALVDAAGWLGDSAAYNILIEGEGLGLRRYEMLLHQECLTPAQEDHVRLVCIPRQQSHLSALRQAPSRV